MGLVLNQYLKWNYKILKISNMIEYQYIGMRKELALCIRY